MRTPLSRRTFVPVLALAAFSVAVLCFLAVWLPTRNEGSVTDRGPLTGADQRNHPTAGSMPPIRLQISSLESALQFEWSSAGDSDASDVELSRYLKIEWVVQEELAKQAVSATLEIRDGQQMQRFTIDPQQLLTGSRTYVPTSNDVRIEMTIEPNQGSEEIAVARFISASRHDADPPGGSGGEIGGTDSSGQLPQPVSLDDHEDAAVPPSTNQSDREFPETPLPAQSEAPEMTESTETAGAKAQDVLLLQKEPAATRSSEDSPAQE